MDTNVNLAETLPWVVGALTVLAGVVGALTVLFILVRLVVLVFATLIRDIL